jgi:hypothetical protein
MATAPMIVNLDTPGEDLARKTVFVKLHLGVLGYSRKVSSAQVEVDAAHLPRRTVATVSALLSIDRRHGLPISCVRPRNRHRSNQRASRQRSPHHQSLRSASPH